MHLHSSVRSFASKEVTFTLHYISPLPPPHLYRLTPNHLHFYAPQAQTISIYHASPPQPTLWTLKRLYKSTLRFLFFSDTSHIHLTIIRSILSRLCRFPISIALVSVPYVNTVWTHALYIWTVTSAWGLMSQRWCLAVSRCCGDSAAFVRRLRGQSLCRSSCHWFCLALTMAVPTLAGITDRLMDILRCVLNASARLIYASRRTEHVTPLLRDLHWLHYPDRIDYKLAVLIYRCLQGLAPNYLWRIHACVRDCVATESLVGFDGQSCRALLSAEDTRRSCIPCGSGSSMEQPTVTCHIIFIVGVFQTQPQELSCSWDRMFKPDIGWCSTSLFWTLLRALEVNIDLRRVNHVCYYYYYYWLYIFPFMWYDAPRAVRIVR